MGLVSPGQHLKISLSHLAYKIISYLSHAWWILLLYIVVLALKLIVVCPFVLFFWPLFCLYFFDIRILITSLESSNSFDYDGTR